MMRKGKGRNFHPFIAVAAAAFTASALVGECRGKGRGKRSGTNRKK